MTEESFNRRNLLYESKRSALSKISYPLGEALYENPKKEIDQLRAYLRRKYTYVIRHKAKIDELTRYLGKVKAGERMMRVLSAGDEDAEQITRGSSNLMIEFAECKRKCDELTKENDIINGYKNYSEKYLRETKSALENCKKKLREVEIIYKMRQYRFEEELELAKQTLTRPPPEDPDLELRSGLLSLLDFLRYGVCSNIFDIFVNSANQSEKRKTSSLLIFKSSINELRKSPRNCVLLSCRAHEAFMNLLQTYNEDYSQIPENQNGEPRSKFNEWLRTSILDLDQKPPKTQYYKELTLFRLLALFYRTQYPLKGETYLSPDKDLITALYSRINQALLSVLIL